MATVTPLCGIRFSGEHVRFGGVLAPPYDVISAQQRDELYGRDLRNIVRIDYGKDYEDDIAGERDRYSRAAQHLEGWLRLGILVQERRPAVYVVDHTFVDAHGSTGRRRGLIARVPALPWERADIRPHERTLRGPKEDRLRLMRATRAQTSAVFGMWDRAPGLGELLDSVAAGERVLKARIEGEVAEERLMMWCADDPSQVASVVEALGPARLYIADGHHRYETAVAYAEERRAAEGDRPRADWAQVLVYLSDAADPALAVLPTHRLVRPGEGIPATLAELGRRLGERFRLEHRPSLDAAAAELAALRRSLHAFAVAAGDGAGLLTTPRRDAGSPRAGLDVVVLQDELLAACGLDAERVSAGALAYTRDVAEASAAVSRGEAALAVVCNGCSTDEIIAVSDAGETMPQKSTYFYPKVPTGLVIARL